MKKVDSLLIAIMISEPLHEGFSYFNLTAKFKEKFNDLFNKVDPISIAGGQAVPPEVPRYILKNEEEMISEFTFSGIRFDFRFLNIEGFTPEFIHQKLELINSILNDFDLKPFRIGAVVSGKINLEKDEFFLEKYLNMEQFINSAEFQLSFRNTISQEGYNLNEWIRYNALNKDKTTNFELDFNTMNFITLSSIIGFSDIVSKKIGDFIER